MEAKRKERVIEKASEQQQQIQQQQEQPEQAEVSAPEKQVSGELASSNEFVLLFRAVMISEFERNNLLLIDKTNLINCTKKETQKW